MLPVDNPSRVRFHLVMKIFQKDKTVGTYVAHPIRVRLTSITNLPFLASSHFRCNLYSEMYASSVSSRISLVQLLRALCKVIEHEQAIIEMRSNETVSVQGVS